MTIDAADAADAAVDDQQHPAPPSPPTTGDASVNAALGQLAAATDAPIGEQVDAYDAAHRTLQDRLADLDG